MNGSMDLQAIRSAAVVGVGDGVLARAEVAEITSDGLIVVRCTDGSLWPCEVLDTAGSPARPISLGDRLLVLRPCGNEPGVVLGRVGRLASSPTESKVTIQATELLRLQCGEASIDLLADGKVMIRGEDVLLRAKGTQRIRAGTVAIN